VIPVVNDFLKIRGLWLNPKKTIITNLHDGFNFLGFNFKLYPWPKNPSGYILLIKPAKEKVKNFRLKIKTTMKIYKNLSPYLIIVKLNPIIRG
jgi:RNA-directed DNA polymerase